MLAGRSSQTVVIARNSVLVAAAGLALTLGGAAAASATPGVVDAQSGSSVDVDGTQGTMVPAIVGEQRGLTTQTTDGRPVASDACGVTGSGCSAIDGYGPHTISATTGTSDDPDSALDPDGFQTN